MNGGTNIALAIKQAGQLLKTEDADASRIIVLLTDGRVDTFQGELQIMLVIYKLSKCPSPVSYRHLLFSLCEGHACMAMRAFNLAFFH